MLKYVKVQSKLRIVGTTEARKLNLGHAQRLDLDQAFQPFCPESVHLPPAESGIDLKVQLWQ